MKKTIALLLGLMLIMGFALVACGEEATTEESTEEVTTTTAMEEATTTTEEVSMGIPWTEAGEYDGEEVTITGTIDAVNDLWTEKGVAKVTLVMGDPEGEHFNIAISLNSDGTWPDYVAAYSGMLDQIVGQTVAVTGIVYQNEWEFCFEVNLTDSDDEDHDPEPEPVGTLELL